MSFLTKLNFSCFSKNYSDPLKIFLSPVVFSTVFLSVEKLKWTVALKGRTLCFLIKKSAVRVVFFKCKLYLKKLIKFINFFFVAVWAKIVLITCIYGNKTIFLAPVLLMCHCFFWH